MKKEIGISKTLIWLFIIWCGSVIMYNWFGSNQFKVGEELAWYAVAGQTISISVCVIILLIGLVAVFIASLD